MMKIRSKLFSSMANSANNNSNNSTKKTNTVDWRSLYNAFAPPPLNHYHHYYDLLTPMSSNNKPVLLKDKFNLNIKNDKNENEKLNIFINKDLNHLSKTPFIFTNDLINQWKPKMAIPSLDSPLSYLASDHPLFSLKDFHHYMNYLPSDWVYTNWGIKGFPNQHNHASINILLVNAYKPKNYHYIHNNNTPLIDDNKYEMTHKLELIDRNEKDLIKEACILFTKRPSTMSSYAGHVCFPGGKLDEDYDVVNFETAKRELHEELNFGNGETIDMINNNHNRLSNINIDYIGELPAMPDRFKKAEVHPFVGLINQPDIESNDKSPYTIYVGDNPQLIHSSQEVQRVFCVPFKDLINPSNYVFENFREDSTSIGPVWNIYGEKIWGLTALTLWWFLNLVIAPNGINLIDETSHTKIENPIAKTIRKKHSIPNPVKISKSSATLFNSTRTFDGIQSYNNNNVQVHLNVSKNKSKL